jgi:hypothetical protein
VRKSPFTALAATAVMAGGLLALPATMPAASASVRPGIYPCTLTANYPRESSPVVGASGSLSCSGEDTIYVTVCLEQLVTGGWQQVVGSCSTSPTVYSTYISTAGKSYIATLRAVLPHPGLRLRRRRHRNRGELRLPGLHLTSKPAA